MSNAMDHAQVILAAKLVDARQAAEAAIAAIEAETQRAVDAANKARGELAKTYSEHERALDGLNAQHRAEHEARLKEIEVREHRLAADRAALESDRARVSAKEAAAEQRAEYLGRRLRGEAA